jgi:hypothetical protein
MMSFSDWKRGFSSSYTMAVDGKSSRLHEASTVNAAIAETIYFVMFFIFISL